MPIQTRLADIAGLAQPRGYAQVVTATGHLAFVAGQVGTDASGVVVGAGDLGQQAGQALRNLQQVLHAVGADWSDVLKLNWYVVDADDLGPLRRARDELLGSTLGEPPKPASTLVQVAGLASPEFLVEVDAVISLPG